MPHRIQLFMTDDELSRNMLRMVDKITRVLMERFGQRMKSFSKDYVAYVLTSNTVTLSPKQGPSEVVQIELFFILKTYREELKTKFDLVDFPTAKFDGKTYIGRDALEIVSRLHDALSRTPSISDDELLAEIKSIASQEHVLESRVAAERLSVLSILQRGVEPAIKAVGRVSSSLTRIVQLTPPTPSEEKSVEVAAKKPQLEAEYASRSLIDKVVFERNVVRAGIAECLAKLEKLREEGRIDENTYKKMKEVYNAFLG
ncbi:MAG: hypothetical protein QXQ80_03635 [Nitrososphaerota archaeon]